MSFSTKTNEKRKEKINILNKEQNKEFNEINFIKRTLENNTHEVIQDTKLKRITSWRKSQKKFLKNLIFNILSFGIVHLISLCYPNLYIKLYCNPCQAKDCDFFLIEDIYGYTTLCLKIHKKWNNNNNKIMEFDTNITKETFLSPRNNSSNKIENDILKNLTYSFKYKSMVYEYNEESNEIIPVYMNLSKITNKGIINYFSEGLASEYLLMKFKERYGLNEYRINVKLLYLYFINVDIPNNIIIIINSIIEIFLGDYISFLIKLFVVIVLLFIEYNIIKIISTNLRKKDYTLDGEKNKIKVKRKFLMKDNNFYIEIKNADLLPGDILFLKSNDIVPCDCLILEGECIANESNATGNLDIFRKKAINNNNEQFNYKLNNINILFHGMKIIKTISKLKEGFISVLCINIGPNTFKANQYSNILFLPERIKDYKKTYDFFGGDRKINFIFSILIFFLCILLGTGYIFILKMKILKLKELIFSILIRLFCKSLMPIYYITYKIIILLSIIRLKSKKIFCYDKSRLINNSGRINTIFFSKTGTLCQNTFEIDCYHPVYINPKKPGIINYKIYRNNQCKEMNNQLLKYYKEYLKYSIYKHSEHNLRLALKKNETKFYKFKKTSECIALFLECLLSCNNIDKFNNEIFGNIIESTIFNDMKWDIKIKDFIDAPNDNNVNNGILNNNNNNTNNFYNSRFVFINNIICDIFPKQYYKINCNNEMNNKNQKIKRNNTFFMEQIKKNNNNNEITKKNNSSNINPIINDIKLSHINSYKLRIYKKFIIDGTLNSSAIVYNFLTKELRFMIKGMAEDILDICDKNSLPDNLDFTISNYRKNGFIIIICATKLINIEEYDDSNGYDFYLNNLTFCGFITLKNNLKEKVKNSLNDLKKLDCNLIMFSGDNEYNCLSVGFESRIIENKNIFVFDKEENGNNKIIIRKIYSIKNINDRKENKIDNIDEKSSFIYDKYSIHNSKTNLGNILYSKEKSTLKYNNSLIYSSKSKNDNFAETKRFTSQNKDKECRTPIIGKVDNIGFERNSLLFKSDNSSNLNNILQNEKSNNNNTLNSELYEMNTNEEREKLTKSKYNYRQKFQNKKYQDSHQRSQNSYYEKKNTCKEFEKFYYYPGILKKNENLINNCEYCVSGKLLNYLYKNRKNKEYKNLLQYIHKKCKIYFCMSSIDKGIAVDFYRKYQNSFICIIGECQSDFEPIMASNVGINIREPNNFNTILCHFYASNADIICIKKIIMEGKNIDENISLLKVSSFFCIMIINSYILTCFIRNSNVIIGQLNFLEIILLIFSILCFTGKPNKNCAFNPLIKNRTLFNKYYYVQFIGLFLMKLISIYFASINYDTNYDLEIEKLDKIFCTYYFILSIELIFSIIFSFNYITFSKKSVLSKAIFVIIILVLLLYFIILISLNSSNFKKDFLKISFFEYTENLIDSFDDKNRMRLMLICSIDFFCTFFYTLIVYALFYKIAEYKSTKK